MNTAVAQQPEPLQAQVDEALDSIGGLERKLHAIASELDALAVQRQQHVLLEQTCETLAKLADLGAEQLFWGDGHEGGSAAAHLDRVRERVAVFHRQVAEIENRRQAVAGEIAAGREVLAILEDDLDEQRQAEEELRNEWVIERELGPERERIVAMPWVGGAEDDRRLRKFLGQALAAALLLSAVLPLIDIPLPEPAEVVEVPARLVELIRERRPLPPPQQVADERRPERQREAEQPTEPPPDREPQQVAAAQPTEAAPAPEPAGEGLPNEEPGQRARQSGILAFRETFADAANRPAAALGATARITAGGDSAAGRPERAMVATLAPGSSGGINVGSISRGLGSGAGDGAGNGGGLVAGVTAAREGGVIGGSGGGGGAARPIGGASGVAGRTDEEIQIVFDRHKAALYRFYNRELRNDPSLRGQMVLKLTIEPNGSVSFLELQSSDMKAPALVEQVLERVRTFDFGAKDVAAITIVYPIDFLPAA
jgi:outer membrane biosynthesis protein TonB